MYDYDELADRQDRITTAMRRIDDALEEISGLHLDAIADELLDVRNDLESKLPEIDMQMCEAKRTEEIAANREYFDGLFESASSTSFWTNCLEV